MSPGCRAKDARVIVAPVAVLASWLPQATQAQDADTSVLEQVVVTGSRFERHIGDSFVPVTVVEETDLRRAGNDAIGKALQKLPQNTGSPPNTNVNNPANGAAASGAARISLRGFGPERTLVLLNGRRIGFSGLGGDSSVDLNTIPASLVERVEVSTGASAIYGSDAVAGVVNLITRPSFQGMEVEVGSLASLQGDGRIQTARALLGKAGERSSIAAGVEIVDQRGVKQSAREYSRTVLGVDEPAGPIVESGSPVTPQGFFRLRGGNVFGLPRGRYTLIAGHTATTASDFRPVDFSPQDLFNYAPYNYLQTPSRRAAGWLFGNAGWGPVQPFYEAYYSMRKSNQVLAAATFISREPGAAPPINGGTSGQGIPADNFYNPFGNDVLAVQRRMLELGDRTRSQKVAAWRAVAGLRGKLRDWSWEFAYGRSDQTTVQHGTGDLLRSRTRLALGPSGLSSAGDVVCGDPDQATGIVPAAAVIAGCVPLNLFGGQGVNGNGTVTAAQSAYVSAPLTDHGENREDLVTAQISGDLVRLPAGPLRAAFGVDWRNQFTRFALDPLAENGGVTGGDFNDLPQGASFHASAIFVEAEAPLLANLRWVRDLSINVGARHSEFSSFGSNDSLRAGLRWELAPAIAFRGNYEQLFRAPDLASLYGTNIPVLDAVSDPCGQSGQTSEQNARCITHGVPNGRYEQGDIPFVPGLGGGDRHLAPESGRSLGAGVVLRTPGVSRLSFSLDYWRIDLEDAIGALSGQAIVDGCVNADVQPLCARIERAADGSIDVIDERMLNLGRLAGSGYDIALTWQGAAFGGQLSGALGASYLARFDTTPSPGVQRRPVAGRWDDDFNPIALPSWRGAGSLDWRRRRWKAGYAVEYIGSYVECRLFDEPATVCYHRVKPRLYHDIEAGYEPAHGWSFNLSISNLTDENPPLVFGAAANTDPATYRLLGRTYAVRVGYRFQ